MAGPRIRGENIVVQVIRAGSVLQEFTSITDFEWTPNVEGQSQGYLGESFDRPDEVYKDTSGTFNLHMDSKKVYDLIFDIVDRARRNIVAFKLNITATMNYPGGDVERLLFPDCMWSSGSTTRAAGRTEYIGMPIAFKCVAAKRLG